MNTKISCESVSMDESIAYEIHACKEKRMRSSFCSILNLLNKKKYSNNSTKMK